MNWPPVDLKSSEAVAEGGELAVKGLVLSIPPQPSLLLTAISLASPSLPVPALLPPQTAPASTLALARKKG